MKSLAELAKYIRFQLSELRAENKHHEFEHLARQFARLRICENILPATGPVSKGGDQGRDFETYLTYLKSSPIADSTFLGSATNKKIVFACSLQQNIVPKIKSDVTVIFGGSQKPDAVYYFSEADVPIAERHALQDWCRETFQAELEIFDGQALSEQLTGLDVFWIAEQFLAIPSNLYPPSKTPGATYEKFKERWLIHDERPHSYADFFQVKYGLREATFQKEAKPDLPDWLRKMEAYLADDCSADFRSRSAYEICVATLRGLNNLTEKKGLVETYFSGIDELEAVSEIQDATTLLSYCSSALLRGHFDIEADKLVQWTTALISKIDEALGLAKGVGTRCRLLQIRGQAAHLQFRKGKTPDGSLEETFNWWLQLLKEVDNAPLFPLEDFADLLTIIAEIADGNEQFVKLTQKTDELLEKRSSGYIAAEKCRDRALAYYNANKFLLAIKQLHQAKIKWFTAETLYGSLLSMLILSDCYHRLGLIYPAKYYAACVAFISLNHDDEAVKKLIPRALFMHADLSYFGGEWMNFAHISKYALAAHNIYNESPQDIMKHDELQALFTHTTIVRTLTKRFDQDLSNAFDTVFSIWPINPGMRARLESLATTESTFWRTASIEELWKVVQSQLGGHPFSDVGNLRSICWKALGVSWKFEFENAHLVSCISEEIVSTLQIILADLATKDLVLMPTKVLVTTFITKGRQFEVIEVPSNEVATWKVGVPESWIKNPDALDQLGMSILSLAMTLLISCSALDYKSLMCLIKRAFSEGLPAKTFAVRPYAELCAEFLSDKEFYSLDRRVLRKLFASFVYEHREHEQLAWMDKSGPGYSKEKAKRILKKRYEGAIRPIKLTLPRLLHDEAFRNMIRKLRQEGYLDWEILLLISNICVDYRVKQIVAKATPDDEFRRVMIEQMFRDEKEGDPEIPLGLFSEERIQIQKAISLGAIAKTWGLEVRLYTPDFAALKRLLDARYHNSEDDISHQDLFINL